MTAPGAEPPCSPPRPHPHPLASSEDHPKAMVSLHPQWDRVLGNDSVTLTCQGAHPPGDNSTQWFHNGSSLSNQTSSYVIAAARAEDSGEYRCRTGLSGLSDPVRLEVHAGEWAEGKGAPAPKAVADGRPREPRGEPETTPRGRAPGRGALWPAQCQGRCSSRRLAAGRVGGRHRGCAPDCGNGVHGEHGPHGPGCAKVRA